MRIAEKFLANKNLYDDMMLKKLKDINKRKQNNDLNTKKKMVR